LGEVSLDLENGRNTASIAVQDVQMIAGIVMQKEWPFVLGG
jgi:hypothetical protein